MSSYRKYLNLAKQENYNEMAVSGATKTILGANRALKSIGATSVAKDLKNAVSAVNTGKQLIKNPTVQKASKMINKINGTPVKSMTSSVAKTAIKGSLLTKYLGNKSKSKNTDSDDKVREVLNLIQKNYTLLKNNIFKKLEQKMEKEKDSKEKTNEIKIFYAILQKDNFIEYIISQYPKYKDDFEFHAEKEKIEDFLKNIEKIISEIERDLLKINDIKNEVKRFPLLKGINIDKIISEIKSKTGKKNDKDENKILKIVSDNFSDFHKNFMNIVKENSGDYRIPNNAEPIFRAIMVSLGEFDKFIDEMPNLNNFKSLSGIEKIKFVEEKIKSSGLKTGIENNSLLRNIN